MLHLRAKSYGKLPSEMLGIEDGLTAWNFDKHVHAIGTRFEALMQQPKMTGEKALRELEREGQPIRKMSAFERDVAAMVADMARHMEGKTQ